MTPCQTSLVPLLPVPPASLYTQYNVLSVSRGSLVLFLTSLSFCGGTLCTPLQKECNQFSNGCSSRPLPSWQQDILLIQSFSQWSLSSYWIVNHSSATVKLILIMESLKNVWCIDWTQHNYFRYVFIPIPWYLVVSSKWDTILKSMVRIQRLNILSCWSAASYIRCNVRVESKEDTLKIYRKIVLFSTHQDLSKDDLKYQPLHGQMANKITISLWLIAPETTQLS